MKSTVENLEPTRVKITVEAEYDELKSAIDKAYKDVAAQVNVPGFRRGKVPAAIIDQRVGRGAVIEQAVNSVLPGFYSDAIRENKIKVLGQPEVSVSEVPGLVKAGEGQLIFTAEVDVRPEFELPKMKGITLTVPDAEVSDEDVEERLNDLRKRFGTLQSVERAVEDGDFVVIDLVANVDGEEVESVSAISYEVGSKTMIDGLDDALVGLSASEEATFTAALVAGEHAGKDAEVTVTVSEVKERELPEVNDDFVQIASEFDTVEELREDLAKGAAAELVAGRAAEAQRKLMEHLKEEVTFPLPAAFVDEEVKRHLEREGLEPDDPHGEEVRAETEDSLREQLILDALTEDYQTPVSQQELVDFLLQMSQQYGVDPNTFIQAADQGGQIPMFMGEIMRRKALVAALREVRVETESGDAVDLTEALGEETVDENATSIDVDLDELDELDEDYLDDEFEDDEE